MDQKGFLASLDAVLGLVVVIILMGTIVSVNHASYTNPSAEMGLTYDAQDVMEIMAMDNGQNGSFSVLSKITIILEERNNSAESLGMAGKVAGKFLNNTLPGLKYNLTENNQLKGVTIACNGDMARAGDINTATRNWGNYSFSLYIWR